MEPTTFFSQALDRVHRIVIPVYHRLIKRRIAHIELSRGSSEDHCFVIDRYMNVGAGILCLLRRSCPATIPGLVVPIHIDAINRVFWGWTRSHIFQKIGETGTPAVAHSDSSSAVVLISEVETSRSDSCPSSIFSRDCRTINGLAVRCASRRRHFSGQTSATLGMACHQVGRAHGCKNAAVTTAHPRGESFGDIWTASKRYQTPESVPSSIDALH